MMLMITLSSSLVDDLQYLSKLFINYCMAAQFPDMEDAKVALMQKL